MKDDHNSMKDDAFSKADPICYIFICKMTFISDIFNF